MAVTAGTIASPQRLVLIWRVAAAATLLIFLWQWPFFIGNDFGRVGTYLVHHGYILAWMLLITSFTRTVPLRTLAAFWFVGVFPVMALVLLLSRPMHELLGGGELAYAYLGPLFEELIKPLPILALFAYRVWRGGWQLSATDGLLLGFMVGAGFAFHEDAGYGRVWGEGFDASPWSVLFPTLSYFRGNVAPYHDTLAALMGLSIGFAFLFRHYRLSWIVPVAVWLVVLATHVTGNLVGLSGRAPAPAEAVRTVLFGAQAVLALLVIGIVVAVVLELRILRSVPREAPLFPPVRLGEFIAALRQRTAGGLRRLHAVWVYVRLRRSLYYTLWSEPKLAGEKVEPMIQVLYSAGLQAGVPVAETFAAFGLANVPSQPDGSGPAPAAAGS